MQKQVSFYSKEDMFLSHPQRHSNPLRADKKDFLVGSDEDEP